MDRKLYTEEQVVKYAKELRYICAENAMDLPMSEERYLKKLKCIIAETKLPPLPEPFQIIDDTAEKPC